MPRRPPKPRSPKPTAPRTNAGADTLARNAIAREESVPGDKVRMTFRVVLGRPQAEALAARAIREEKNLVTLVEEILDAAATQVQQ
jgi:hypothetical protein